jgi:Domain of unknown function (DUF4422)
MQDTASDETAESSPPDGEVVAPLPAGVGGDAALPPKGSVQANVCVLIYAHKPFVFPPESRWLRPMISADCPTDVPWALRNDDGDNIAGRGAQFNELTAIYWLWKNQTGYDIVGLYHYRRYLNFYPINSQRPEVVAAAPAKTVTLLSDERQKEKIISILSTYDVIVPQGNFVPRSLEAHYLAQHSRTYWDRFWEIAFDLYPEYTKVRDFLVVSNKAHFFNIFVSSKSWLDRYAEHLFKILVILTDELGYPDPEPGKRFQEFRYPGYLSERFFMLYLFANRSRVFETQLVILSEEQKKTYIPFDWAKLR